MIEKYKNLIKGLIFSILILANFFLWSSIIKSCYQKKEIQNKQVVKQCEVRKIDKTGLSKRKV